MTKPATIRLDPAALRRTAQRQLQRVEEELPNDKGLAEVARLTLEAVERADGLIQRMRRLITLHHLPVAFLAIALIGVSAWVWLSFFHTSVLTLAISERDPQALHAKLINHDRLHIKPLASAGSRESLALLTSGNADLAFVQGGFEIPPRLLRREVSSRALVLYFVRKGVQLPEGVRTIVTSVEGQGSHTVLKLIEPSMHLRSPTTRHTWHELTQGHPPEADVDAVFVVKDPADETTLVAAATLAAAGFELTAPALGARALRFEFFEQAVIPARWFGEVPGAAIETLAVKTYIVAREGLTPRLLGQAAAISDDDNRAFAAAAVMPSTEMTSEALQGVDAFVGILVNIALAFIGLLSLEAIRWRRPFHELNALVSRLSLLQSQTDMLDIEDATLRRHNRLVLGMVSDQLGLISTLASFYTQENASLLFNSISELVHERCNALKINIQLKILQSNVRD